MLQYFFIGKETGSVVLHYHVVGGVAEGLVS